MTKLNVLSASAVLAVAAILVGPAQAQTQAQPAAQAKPAVQPKFALPGLPTGQLAKPAKTFGVVDVEVPAKARTLVLVLSGDGGWWGDIDRKLAERIAEDSGYAVVGIDTNKWFQKRRTPDEIATYLTGIIKDYRGRTGATQVALVGYSFGADVLPLALNRLAPALAKTIAATVLIAPSRGVDPQVTLMERTGLVDPTIDLAPEFTKLQVKRLLCIYGDEQKAESGCTTPQLSISRVLELPGGHHFDGIPEHLSEPVIAALTEWAPAK